MSHNVTAGPVFNPRSPRGYASAQQLTEQIADLKIELARRDAEVEYLEVQLAEAVAANRPHLRPLTQRSPDKVTLQLDKLAQQPSASLLQQVFIFFEYCQWYAPVVQGQTIKQ